MKKSHIASLVATALVCASGYGYHHYQNKSGVREKGDKQARGSGPVNVKLTVAKGGDMPVKVVATGYAVPIKVVDVRPTSQNTVKAIHVEEGQFVKVGQPLFTLDPRSDEANTERLKAQVDKDKAQLTDANSSLQRSRELHAKGFISKAALETAENNAEVLKGALRVDEASLRGSLVPLENNILKATIAGRIGAISVHEGSLAQPSGSALLTIAQLDPIDVSFSIPERELPSVLREKASGAVPVEIRLTDGSLRKGVLSFIDNTSDTQIGTVKLKARFQNKDQNIWPGMSLEVNITSRTLKDGVLVPAQSVIQGPTDQFVYVEEGGKAKRLPVKILNVDQGVASVSGVLPGAKVVSENMQNVRLGSQLVEAGSKPSKEPATKAGK